MAVLAGPNQEHGARSPLQLHVIAVTVDGELAEHTAATLRAMGAPAVATLARTREFGTGQRTVFCLTAAALADDAFMALLREHAPTANPHTRVFFYRLDEAAAANAALAPLIAAYPSARDGDFDAILAWFNGECDKFLADLPKIPEKPAQSPPRTTTSDSAVLASPSPSRFESDQAMLSSPPRIRLDPSKSYYQERPSAPPPAPAAKKAEEAPRPELKRAPPPKAAPSEQAQSEAYDRERDGYAVARGNKPAKRDRVDARAYAPKKLRAGASELIRVALFRPKDRARAAKAARKADPNARLAGAPQTLGKIERGTALSAIIDAYGATCTTARQDATWTGAPLDFDFVIDVDPQAPRAVFVVRILAEDAQIGAITFVRDVRAPKRKRDKSEAMQEEKLRRVERVFLSYSSQDRQTVSMIASAYRRAGIPCFFDRSSLKGGEEWSPRLFKEINRADLFHLCWSKSAAASQWVHNEAEYALKRNRKTWSRMPDITVQMLDGPPWAQHPPSLDVLNFDDYARAAIVGYARGEN